MPTCLVSELRSDRRSSVRYKLCLPVIFHWSDECEHTYSGITMDISLSGAFVLSEKWPAKGNELKIELILNSWGIGRKPLRIKCNGRVTRTSVRDGGFAVQGCFDDKHLTGGSLLAEVNANVNSGSLC